MPHRSDAYWLRRLILAAATAYTTLVLIKAWRTPPEACWTNPDERSEWAATALDG
jgi:hypothetical protein